VAGTSYGANVTGMRESGEDDSAELVIAGGPRGSRGGCNVVRSAERGRGAAGPEGPWPLPVPGSRYELRYNPSRRAILSGGRPRRAASRSAPGPKASGVSGRRIRCGLPANGQSPSCSPTAQRRGDSRQVPLTTPPWVVAVGNVSLEMAGAIVPLFLNGTATMDWLVI
jgi:hypothetical protein